MNFFSIYGQDIHLSRFNNFTMCTYLDIYIVHFYNMHVLLHYVIYIYYSRTTCRTELNEGQKLFCWFTPHPCQFCAKTGITVK